MPIHDLGYRHWSGNWTSHPYRWWVITRQGIALRVQKKMFLVVMLFSLLPFLVRSVILYFATSIGRNLPVGKIDAKFFEDFLSQQMFFVFVIAIYAGAGLIADDLKVNALQIYLSKPITRHDYLLGKLGVLIFFLALPTLIPGLLLFLMAGLFQSTSSFFEEYYWVAAAILAYSLVIMFTYALVMLALSSLSRSRRFAGIAFAAVFFFTQILYGILSEMLRTRRVAWVSLSNNVTQIGDLLFGTAPQYTSPLWVSAVALVCVMAACVYVAHRRVRAVEVVR